MPFVPGSDTAIWLDGRDITTYFNEFGLSAEVDNIESTTFGVRWKSHVAGQAGIDVSGSGFFDPTMTDLTAAVGAAAGSVLTYGLGTLALDKLCRLVPIREASFEETSPIGGLVGFAWAALSDGIPGMDGRVIAALEAVTADQNGTAVDNGAQTTTGAIAHLHVTEVSASDSIICHVQDASVPSGGGANWATIGSFASKSAVGAERIVIAGTIRRYTRVVDDVTGAAVSIRRGVALART